MYVSCSQQITSYTGDKNSFLGKGGLANPQGTRQSMLNNQNSLGKNSCIAYEIEVEIESYENKEIVFILGAENTQTESKSTAYKYRKIQNAKNELENIKK